MFRITPISYIYIRKIKLKLSHVIYRIIYIKKAELFTNIYFKAVYNSLFLPHIMYYLEI